MNYCKDCRFHAPGGGSGAASAFGVCIAWPEACKCPGLQPWVRNLVTGEIDQGYLPPAQQREDQNACGLEGRWFQLKVQPAAVKLPDLVEETPLVAVQSPVRPGAIFPVRAPSSRWWQIFGSFK